MGKSYKSFSIDGKTASKIVIDSKEVSKIVDYSTGDVLYEGVQYPPSTSGWDWHGKNYTVSASGRWFARYSDVSGNPDVGTVMSMNDGTNRNILVLDAQYRTETVWLFGGGSVDVNSSGNKLDVLKIEAYFSGSSITLPCTGFSDDTLNSSYSTVCNKDTKTSRYNTNKMIAFDSSNARAFTHCRGISVNETTCDLPNINTLVRMYCEMIILDNLDTTSTSSRYNKYALCNWSASSLVSSSYYGITEGTNDYRPQALASVGYINNRQCGTQVIVAPILEI